MNKKSIIIFSTFLLFISAAGFLLFFYKNSKKNIESLKPFVFSNNSPNTIVEEIYRNVNLISSLKFSPPEKYSQWWVSDDKWNILDGNAMAILIKIPIDNIDNYQSQSNSANSLAKTLNKTITNIFESNDFQLKSTDTFKTIVSQGYFDSVVALQKGETRCALTISSGIETNGQSNFFTYFVICSDQFQKAYQEQILYLRALNDRNNIISSEKRIGDFVFLNINEGMMIGKMEGEKINIIYSGQDYPPCNLMENNQVPKEVYEKCDESNYPYTPPTSYKAIYGGQ
ncbi:MAG: hypothetical protein PHY72_04410 [Candidatus Pacebacteria bacterium]|nr:hypothetical protein [Candidatus Paceibacterota bacterium]